jgi:hypothetical protein
MPDTAEERVLVEPFETRPEFGCAGRQVPDGAHHDVVGLSDVQHPLVVLQQWAALNLDGAHDAQPIHDLAVSRGQGRHVHHLVRRVVLAGPWHAPGTLGIEQVNMRIDDGYGWRGLRARIRQGQPRGNAEKCSSIHRWKNPAMAGARYCP